MLLDELTIGEEVKVYRRGIRGERKNERKTGYSLKCAGRITAMTAEYILVDNGNYKSRFDIIDFRIREYRLFKICGTEVKFLPLPDKAAIDEAVRRKMHEEYQNTTGKFDKASTERQKNGTAVKWEKVKQLLDAGRTPEEIVEELHSTVWIVKGLMARYKYNLREDDKKMAMMTKETVRKMAEVGMDTESIAKEFQASYPNAKPSVLKAKVTMLLSGKSNRPKKEKTEIPQTVPSSEDCVKEEETVPLTILDSDPAPEAAVHSEKGMSLNMEFENAIQAMEDEAQLKRDRQAAIAMAKRKPLLKPQCMIGELTGRAYVFQDNGIDINGYSVISWDELGDLIEELKDVRDMRSV